MYQEEHVFTLRFSLEASFPDEYEGDQDNRQWVQEWEAVIKPQVLKTVFESLRRQPGWNAHVRNRGVAPSQEVEIVLDRDFSTPPPFSLRS